MPVHWLPRSYTRVIPYLVVSGATGLVEFIERALDGKTTERVPGDDGTVRHAEVRIGDSMVMVGEAGSAKEPMPAMLYVYVPDADATYRRALAEGATSIQEPADTFYGDRNAGVKDPCGNQWWVATHKEDLTPEEIARRAAALGKK
ncbi:MAG: VOC family protein [Planctomycetes bacterium]|nr:VOC family protein [Planctomycetota bacterium]